MGICYGARMDIYDDDAALIEGCLANERRAWNTFVSTFTRYVYYMIETTRSRYGANLNEEDKADLHASIFVSFIEDDYRRLREFEGRNQCSLRSWVRMITIRKTIDLIRKKKPRQVSIENLRETRGYEAADETQDPLAQLLTAQEAARTPELEQLVAQLSDTDQLLLKLFLVDQLKASEVARALGISVGAVYTRKNRLIERLREARKKSQNDV